MTNEKKSRKKHWTGVLHDHGGYALFDEEGRLLVRCLNREAGIEHHANVIQKLIRVGTRLPLTRYPIVFQQADELSPLATTPFRKPKVRKT